jgi:hypothetical protein
MPVDFPTSISLARRLIKRLFLVKMQKLTLPVRPSKVTRAKWSLNIGVRAPSMVRLERLRLELPSLL